MYVNVGGMHGELRCDSKSNHQYLRLTVISKQPEWYPKKHPTITRQQAEKFYVQCDEQ